MRQIKFRAWHTKHEQLADVAVIDFNDFGGNGTITTEYGDEWGLEWCVLEQFTRWQDKFDGDIYEGDKVRASDQMFGNSRVRTWIVISVPGGFAYQLEGHDGVIRRSSLRNIQIIGNIHEDEQ